MRALSDILFVALILSGFGLLGSSRLATCIGLAALQGVAVGLLVPALSGFSARTALVAVAVVSLKGVVFPRLLARAIRDSDTSREVRPFVGYTFSIAAGALALGASLWAEPFERLSALAPSPLVVPVSFTLLITGLFVIVSRRTAVSQVVGFIVLENGIYTFGAAVAGHIPLLVELGVLMDVFVAVFVMGIAIYRINEEFDHIDSTRLDSLRG